MLAAARLEATLGRWAHAERLLGEMLEQRESSALTGSYERGYDRAQYQLAELTLKDGRWRIARELWLELVDDFPWSRLRDDALWAATLVSSRNQDTKTACALAGRILRETPNSRYAACTDLLCEDRETSSPAASSCADYVRRSVEQGALRPAPTFD
jgi:hypothetical protein